MKIPVVNKPDYTMYLELFDDKLWFHTDVRKWSPKVKKQYMTNLDVLQYLSNCYFYALIEDSNTKLQKFAKTIGFKPERPILGQDNKMYNIYGRSI